MVVLVVLATANVHGRPPNSIIPFRRARPTGAKRDVRPASASTTSPTCATGTATIYNTCSPDQAAYNALTDFFNATEGQVYFRGTLSIPEGCTGKPLKNQPAPIQYVNVNYNDIQYAKEEVCPTQAPAIPGTCTTMLDLLNQTQY